MPTNVLAAATALVVLPASVLSVAHAVKPTPGTRPPGVVSNGPSAPAGESGSSPPGRPSAEQWRAVTDAAPFADPTPSLTARDTRSTSTSGWRWPLAPRPAVVRRFSIGPYRWSPGHRGVDLGAARGAEVLAPADGVASFVRTIVDRPVLVITHAGDIRTAYEPVTAAVASGTRVTRGTVVGRVTAAAGHCAPRTCLHWSARRGDRYIDPLSLLMPPHVVLLPVTSGDRVRDG